MREGSYGLWVGVVVYVAGRQWAVGGCGHELCVCLTIFMSVFQCVWCVDRVCGMYLEFICLLFSNLFWFFNFNFF